MFAIKFNIFLKKTLYNPNLNNTLFRTTAFIRILRSTPYNNLYLPVHLWRSYQNCRVLYLVIKQECLTLNRQIIAKIHRTSPGYRSKVYSR